MNRFLLIFLVVCGGLAASVTDSVVSQLDHYEVAAHLDRKKYAEGQWEEIVEALRGVDERLRVMTYNMLSEKYDPGVGEVNHWQNRCPRIAELIEHDRPHLIGTQELFRNQVDQLLALIGDSYTFYGEEQFDGQCNGIFYTETLEFVEGKVLEMTGGYTLTVVQFADRKTGTQFIAMNVHLPSTSAELREACGRQIFEEAEKNSLPVVVTGDFNTFPNRPSVWQLPFLDGPYLRRLLTAGRLRDTEMEAIVGNFGPLSTVTLDPNEPRPVPFRSTGIPGFILDHIYVTEGVTVLAYAVEPAKVDGHFPSDHLPVVVDLVL